MNNVEPAVDTSLIESPCIRRCTLDADTGWCLGCLRELDEIAAWSGLDDVGKQAVLGRVALRRAALPASHPFTVLERT